MKLVLNSGNTRLYFDIIIVLLLLKMKKKNPNPSYYEKESESEREREIVSEKPLKIYCHPNSHLSCGNFGACPLTTPLPPINVCCFSITYVCVCVCTCAQCVCERERDSERERE